MINLHTKFEVSMFTHYEYIERQQKCRNLGGLGFRGHQQCHHLIVHTTSYSTLIEPIHLSCTVFNL